MILNMHIRLDYPRWGVLDKPKARTTTLCGKITASKYAGVPGITLGQPAAVLDAEDYGWCLECCREFLHRTKGVTVQIDNENLAGLYTAARAITASQLRLAFEATSVK